MRGGDKRRADAAGKITVIYVAKADSDKNGIPDDPFAVLSDEGLVWLATVKVPDTGLTRTVAARRVEAGAPLDEPSATLDLDVLRADGTPQHITLAVPRELIAPDEIGIVLLSVAADPETLLGATEAALLAPGPEGVLVTGAQYVEVSLLVSSDKGATYSELDETRLTNHPIRLTMYDLLMADLSIPSFMSHTTYVDSHPKTGIEILAEPGAWSNVSSMTLQQGPIAKDGTQAVSIEGIFTSLSLFAPFTTGESMFSDTTTTNGDTGDGTDDDTDGDGTGDGAGGGTTTDGTQGQAIIDPDAIDGAVQNSTPTSSAIVTNTAEVWVDFAFLGDEFGTEDRPFNTFAEALAAVEIGGVINVKAGATNETPTFAQAVTVNAVGGPVQVGDPSATQLPGLEGAVIAAFDSTRVDSPEPKFHLLGAEFTTLVEKLSDAGASIIEISTLDADSLAGVDIFFPGLHNGSATTAEQAALLAFVQAGGGLIAFTEHSIFAGISEPITFPFGVEGKGGNPADATTITELNHPVMSGRFGPVDNAGNVYDPEEPGAFKPSSADVLATTVDEDAAILALEPGLGRAIFFNDLSFVRNMHIFSGDGNIPAIMNAFLYVYNNTVGESVIWEEPLVPWTDLGYNGDVYDHNITGNFLHVGDIISEQFVYVSDDMGLDPLLDIKVITDAADGKWRVVSATRHNITGLWRGRFLLMDEGAEFDFHALDINRDSIQDHFAAGATVGTAVFDQIMRLDGTNIEVGRHRITFRFIKIAPETTQGGSNCYSTVRKIHQITRKDDAFNVAIWPFADTVPPLLPCPPP